MPGAAPADDLVLREAALSDAAELFALVEQLAVSYKPQREAFDRGFGALVSPGSNAIVLVAARGHRLVGYALAHLMIAMYANGPICELFELLVDESNRGQGIGTKLVDEVKRRAIRAGAIELNVMTRRAGDFYTRIGFERTADYYKLKLAKQMG